LSASGLLTIRPLKPLVFALFARHEIPI
jgi:hypothetical protein